MLKENSSQNSIEKTTAEKLAKNRVMHHRFLLYSKFLSTLTHTISQKALKYTHPLNFFTILIILFSIKFTFNLRGHWGRVKAKASKGRAICLWVHMLHTPLPFVQNWDVSTQLKFIASIHEINNVRSSQSFMITAYNGLSSCLWYMNQLVPTCSFSYVCDTLLYGPSPVLLISLTSVR